MRRKQALPFWSSTDSPTTRLQRMEIEKRLTKTFGKNVHYPSGLANQLIGQISASCYWLIKSNQK
jgi:hypothetical protein